MIISAIKPQERQQTLWGTENQQTVWPEWVGDRAFHSMAQTRTYCGEFFEEATRDLFQADRHVTNGQADICPDLSLGNHYLEVKSVGKGRQGLVYAQRLEHDRLLLDATGGKLTYIFWFHQVAAGECKTIAHLRNSLANGAVCVFAIPFPEIEAACRLLPAKIMNYRAAPSVNHKKVEMPGYRLSWKLLSELAGNQVGSVSPTAFGQKIKRVVIYSRHPLPVRG